MTARREFDVAVIGTGGAGSTVAFTCARSGQRVAIIDKRPFGGTCALRGCDPKRVLIGAEELVHRSRSFEETGALRGALTIDWPQLMSFKRAFTEPVPRHREASYKEAGIATFHGAARFTDPSTIAVNGELLRANRIVIAAGARPATLSIPGEQYLTTSDEFLELEHLPQTIVFVGGGYISFEFAHLAARCGSKVTILHRGPRPLERFDADLVSLLVAASQAAGIDVTVNTEVRRIERDGNTLRVQTGEKTYAADMVVHGAGRVPELDDLDLQRGDVTHSKKGVTVNAFLQSESNPNVYAAGDAADTGGLRLTPVASLTADIVAENVLHGNRRQADFDAIPSLVFSNPILGAVGARDEGHGAAVEVHAGEMSQWYSYRRTGERNAAYKVIVNKAEDRVLGAHVLGPGAEELINIFALAIRFRLPASQLRDMEFGYPTYSSDVFYML